MHNYTIRQIILSHQPAGGGYCTCGVNYYADETSAGGPGKHQLDMLEADGYDTN